MKLVGHPNMNKTFQKSFTIDWVLGFREYLFGQREQGIQENSGEYLPSNGYKGNDSIVPTF